MRNLILVFCLPIPAQSFALEICDDLWFTRNLMFHRAGHCFGSVLGKAVFGNEACETGGATLGPEATKMVARVRELEAEWECNVDTGQNFLAVPVVAERKALIDPPVPTGYESACVGWKGGTLPLRSAHRADGPISGTAVDGDMLLLQFEDVGDWSFVEIHQNGIPAGHGWAKIKLGEKNCEMVAG